ncbi:MAG TPA: hypothetical protein VEF89_16290 [Solirubrobacteraceae bacterium]|nr:hypothetical protein [Solirubrobacteraceae bacterium]
MSTAITSAGLVTAVELALLEGRNLEQIETEILAVSDVDEETRAVTWLYAWSCQDGVPGGTGSPAARPSPR